MNVEHIVELIQAVSASSVTEFHYEEGNLKLSFTTGEKQVETKPFITCVEQPSYTEEKIIKSPLVGTFYAAPSEQADPFIKVGDFVQKGTVLGIVEAMKLMNEIESEFDGKVHEILVKNGEVVEYGQPLFVIR